MADYLGEMVGDAREPIVIYFGRSIEHIVSILAVLKLGCAYVPVDVEFPAKRINTILKDCGSRIIITNEKYLLRASKLILQQKKLEIVNINNKNIWESSNREKKTYASQGTDVAYIMYTSGSTGSPKGIPITHRAVIRLVKKQNYIRISCDDKIAHAANISFDASIFEIWGALLNGAEAYIFDYSTVIDLDQFSTQISTSRVSILFLTTALFNEIVRKNPNAFDGLHYLLFGGEKENKKVLLSLLKRKKERNLNRLNILHVYGPTENATFSTYYEVNTLDKDENAVPIGKPINTTKTYVLDDDLRLTPLNKTGTLYLGGIGLTPGYLGRSQLTKEKFIVNPFSNDPSDILYNTGDIVSQLPDRNLAFVGRVDNQVKIRGFRVELEEIEAYINKYPGVEQAAVISFDNKRGVKYLIAYIACKNRIKFDIGWLQVQLKQHLPFYMIPSGFVLLAELPLNINKKVDRQALLNSQEKIQPVKISKYSPPNTELEKKLISMYARVLDCHSEEIGIDDGFFDLGGHSLLIYRLIIEINQTLSVNLTMDVFFINNTVRDLARFLSKETEKENEAIDDIRPQRIIGKLPLSFPQEQIWLHQRMVPKAPIYNEPIIMHMQGDINCDVLEESLNFLIRRHEILRTVFFVEGEEIYQEAKPFFCTKLQFIDLSNYHLLQGYREACRHGRVLLEEMFCLDQLPLIRFMFVKLSDKRSMLFIVAHHLIIDGVTMMQIFMKELEAVYIGLSKKEIVELVPLDLQYSDFSVWQRNIFNPKVSPQHLKYWKKRLDKLPFLDWQILVSRNTSEIHNEGSCYHFRISKKTVDQLKYFSSQCQMSLFMALFSVFSILLCSYTHQTDLPIATVIDGRQRFKLDKIMGNFLNTLIIRADLSGDPSIIELFQRLKVVLLEAYMHQDVPFQQVVQHITRKSSGMGNAQDPIQALFVFEPYVMASELGWRMTQTEIHNGIAKFDLTFELDERKDYLIARVEYRTSLFNRKVIQQLIGYYKSLLEAVVENYQLPISKLFLLSKTEKQKLLFDWNDTKVNYPTEKIISNIFEKQAIKTPNNVALIFKNHELTYKELNKKSNRLAYFLIKLGVCPESMVALCFERSFEMVIALLGIMKAGGVYVPLDPLSPMNRTKDILDDSKPVVLLTTEKLQLKLENVYDKKIISLDSGWIEIAKEKSHNPEVSIKQDNAIYVLYTSGSTGKPKGVVNIHEAISDRMYWIQKQYHLNETDVVLLKTPYTFDVSGWEFYWPLLNGAKLLITKPGGHKDPEYLASLIFEKKVTHIHFVPSMLQGFMSRANLKKCKSIEKIFCIGEVLPEILQKEFFHNFEAELHNLYGPTEAAIMATYWQCDLTRHPGKVPIGKPIANTTMYVLNESLQLISIGAVGELYIGGVGLARGYLNRPELTTKAFIQSPFDPKERLYKTGDLVRWLPDGNLEYIGRIDDQVKIRGFRVELGEIESRLLQFDNVTEVKVLVYKGEDQKEFLIAFLVLEEKDELPHKEKIAQHLKQFLPEYMVPSKYFVLDTLPLTMHGKIDKSALIDLMINELKSKVNYIEPRTKIQKKLANIYKKVLEVNRVSVHDNFFELGGHSLLAFQLLSEIQKEFSVELQVKDIFELPTIVGLEDEIKELQKSKTSKSSMISTMPSPLVSIKGYGIKIPLFLVHPVGGTVFLYHPLGKYLPDERPLFGLQDPGVEAKNITFSSLREMAELYVDELKQVQPRGPYMLGGSSSGATIAIEMANILKEQGEKTSFLGLLDGWAVYPKNLKERKFLEDRMNQYYQHWRNWFTERGIKSADALYDLQWQRGQLVNDYEVSDIDHKLILFKAKELFDFFEPIQHPQNHWDKYAQQGVDVHIVPGNHETMFHEPNVQVLARKLNECLEDLD